MINEQGGVNGRKINLISLDDGYSPPKTVEQVRRLVEEEKVALPVPDARHRAQPRDPAVSQRQQGAAAVRRRPARACSPIPSTFPGRSATIPSYQTEARIYAKHILRDQARRARSRVLYQNDGFGKDYLIGLKDVLGAEHAGHDRQGGVLRDLRADRRIRRSSRLQGSGADMLHHRRDAEIRGAGDPQVLRSRLERRRAISATSRPRSPTVLKPAGLEKSKGLITAGYVKDADRPALEGRRRHEGMEGVLRQIHVGQTTSSTPTRPTPSARRRPMVQVLKQCGDDLSRENIMKQAASLKDFAAADAAARHQRSTPRPTNFSPIRQMQLARFDGESLAPCPAT